MNCITCDYFRPDNIFISDLGHCEITGAQTHTRSLCFYNKKRLRRIKEYERDRIKNDQEKSNVRIKQRREVKGQGKDGGFQKRMSRNI